jgi:putative NIF3 family GTP cyclohydrolase 1 type 2
MTVQEIYDLAIELGIKNDLRGQERIYKNLEQVKKKFEKLEDKKKKYFDQERFKNPYSDCRILHSNNKEVKTVLCGIDIDTSELLLAKHLNDIDLVITHHPAGHGLAGLDDVMSLQTEVLAGYGVPINVAQSVLKLKIEEVSRGISRKNLYKTVDAAKLLDLSLMSVHTASDNMVATFLKKNIEDKKFTYVQEILDALLEIPEYIEAEKKGFGPRLFAGHPENYAGKVAITEITGGTEGSPKIYEKMSQAGIGTVVGMHMSEEHKTEAEENHINAIIAGHMSSDSLGMNLFLDELEKRGIKVMPCSGLIRVNRVEKLNI